MYFLSTIISATASIIHMVLTLYTWIIIIAVALSWVNPDPYNPIVRTLRTLTEPVLWRVRRLMPFLNFNGIDLSPIAVLLALQFLDQVLVRSLSYIAIQMMM